MRWGRGDGYKTGESIVNRDAQWRLSSYLGAGRIYDVGADGSVRRRPQPEERVQLAEARLRLQRLHLEALAAGRP